MTDRPPNHTIETITSLDRLKEVAPALKTLAESLDAQFFQNPTFFIPWCEIAVKRKQVPHFLAAWDANQRMIGFVPLCRRRDPKALFATRLAPPRIGTSPPFDILLASDIDRKALIGALATVLKGQRWLDITLSDALEDSVFNTLLAPALKQSGLNVTCSEGRQYLQVGVFETVDGYLSHFKSKNRSRLKKQFKRCDDATTVVTIDTPDKMPQASEWIRSVIAKSWKDTAYLHDIFLPLLDTQLLEMSAEGMSRVRFAMVEDVPIAFLVEFINLDGSPGSYYNAHNPDFNHISPGLFLLQTTVRETIENSQHTYSFWGDREYLRKLSTTFRPTVDISMVRRGVRAGVCKGFLNLIAKARSGGKLRETPAETSEVKSA